MRSILENIVGFQPVYRVLDREKNLNFFREVLGMKVLMEEGAMVWMGGHGAKMLRFFLEESPGLRPVNGAKKHGRTVIKAAPAEIEQLLIRNLEQVSKVYRGKQGWAFEAISPEQDLFLVTADALSELTEVDKAAVSADKDLDFIGLSDFQVLQLDLNVAEQETQGFFERVFGLTAADAQGAQLLLTFGAQDFVGLNFVSADGADLSASMDATLDLEFLAFKLAADFDLTEFAAQFDRENEIDYLDPEGKTLILKAPNQLELWFAK